MERIAAAETVLADLYKKLEAVEMERDELLAKIKVVQRWMEYQNSGDKEE